MCFLSFHYYAVLSHGWVTLGNSNSTVRHPSSSSGNRQKSTTSRLPKTSNRPSVIRRIECAMGFIPPTCFFHVARHAKDFRNLAALMDRDSYYNHRWMESFVPADRATMKRGRRCDHGRTNTTTSPPHLE